ncbi:profilin-4-like [Carassius auratus]|uniref:Profilin n=1 Tax=Carassius auratus TaxID=7957 RepID=A0A6P6R907_CARAU|nr:profilin-4-like [Carassius auratus]XP_026141932.1 profilin-4-like [Carassius auratus]XP_052437366.1 profilin-4 [Carassius gibelio]
MNPFPKLLEGSLIDTKHVESAAIFVARTGDVRAASNFTVCPEQTRTFLDAFKQVNVTRQRGLDFRSKHYTCVRADKHSIYTKCEGHGLILVRTALYVIVATYSQSMYPSICVEAVEKLAEYLREKGN